MGYVYLLKSNKKDTLKIGMTTNLEQRLKSFKSSSKNLGIDDETFEFLHTVKVDKCYELENLLHKKFADKRVCGEWFNITKEEFIDMLESIDLNKFAKIETVKPEVPFYMDNYILLSALFKTNIICDFKFQSNLMPWIEKTDHKYYNNHLYVNIEEIPFIFYDAVWYMMKGYHTKRYFDEFILYPLLDNLHSVLTYSQITDLFSEDLTDIENWRDLAHE